MIIKKDDLYCSNSLTVTILNQLEKDRKQLEKQASRIWQLDIGLVAYIQEGKITDTNDIDLAISYLNHTDLEPIEILHIITEERK